MLDGSFDSRGGKRTSFVKSSRMFGFNGMSIYTVPAIQHSSPCRTSRTRSTRRACSPAIYSRKLILLKPVNPRGNKKYLTVRPSQAAPATCSTAGFSLAKRKKYMSPYCC